MIRNEDDSLFPGGSFAWVVTAPPFFSEWHSHRQTCIAQCFGRLGDCCLAADFICNLDRRHCRYLAERVVWRGPSRSACLHVSGDPATCHRQPGQVAGQSVGRWAVAFRRKRAHLLPTTQTVSLLLTGSVEFSRLAWPKLRRAAGSERWPLIGQRKSLQRSGIFTLKGRMRSSQAKASCWTASGIARLDVPAAGGGFGNPGPGG